MSAESAIQQNIPNYLPKNPIQVVGSAGGKEKGTADGRSCDLFGITRKLSSPNI